MKKLLETIGGLAITTAFVGSLGILGLNITEGLNRRARELEVIKMIDKDGDGEPSESEYKRFYDETGITPYNPIGFKNVTKRDFEQFLSNYELRMVKKE